MNTLMLDCKILRAVNTTSKAKCFGGRLTGLEVPAEFSVLLLIPHNFHDAGVHPDKKPPATCMVRVSKKQNGQDTIYTEHFNQFGATFVTGEMANDW